VTDSSLAELDAQVKAEVEQAVDFAEESPEPTLRN
jgi:TPP-dependent pyruvate/acetoin dehydrogenase alpha subunit